MHILINDRVQDSRFAPNPHFWNHAEVLWPGQTSWSDKRKAKTRSHSTSTLTNFFPCVLSRWSTGLRFRARDLSGTSTSIRYLGTLLTWKPTLVRVPDKLLRFSLTRACARIGPGQKSRVRRIHPYHSRRSSHWLACKNDLRQMETTNRSRRGGISSAHLDIRNKWTSFWVRNAFFNPPLFVFGLT